MANEQNLIRTMIKKGQLSKEEARSRGSKGGKKSVESKNRKKEEEKLSLTFKDLFKELVDTQVTEKNDGSSGKIYRIVTQLFPNLPPEEITQKVVAYASLYRILIKGGKGSVAAFTAIRDTMGEKPVDRSETIPYKPKEEDEEIAKESAKKEWGLVEKK